jgi:hypothetical protein
MRSTPLSGTVRIAETRWPRGSVKMSCSSTVGIVAELEVRRERQSLEGCRFLALVGPDAEITRHAKSELASHAHRVFERLAEGFFF